jgi:hypothetical protein
MYSDGGGRRGAAVLLLYTLTFGLSTAVCATAEEPDASDSAERYGIDPARLGAVSAASRALFVEVLGRLDGMRGELEELCAGKARLDERAEGLSVRVAMLEESECECGEGEEEQEEMVTARRLEDDTQPMLVLTHRSAKVWYHQLELDFDSLALHRMQTGDPLHSRRAREPAYILKREAMRISTAQSEGHRRSQSGDGYGDWGGTCDVAALPSRTAAITTECCDEQSEDCSGGYPQVCNVGCASLFLPFWDECRSELGKDSRNFEPTVQLCAAVDGSLALLVALP